MVLMLLCLLWRLGCLAFTILYPYTTRFPVLEEGMGPVEWQESRLHDLIHPFFLLY